MKTRVLNLGERKAVKKARRKLFNLFVITWLVAVVVCSFITIMTEQMIEIKESIDIREAEVEIDKERLMKEYEKYLEIKKPAPPTSQVKLTSQIKLTGSRTKEFVRDYTNGQSPLIGYIDVFLEDDKQEGMIALAIAGNETLFGTSPNHYNAWGYGCNSGYPGGRFDCGWRDWEYAIKRYKEVARNYLELFDGTKESIQRIADAGYYKVGMDGSSIKDQQRWVNNIYWFYTNIYES